MHETPLRQIRAAFDDQTVRVYQAYGHDIAAAAIASQTLVAPFRRDRVRRQRPVQYVADLPAERPYPLAAELEWRIGIAASGRTEWS